jgi:hypothetical protein
MGAMFKRQVIASAVRDEPGIRTEWRIKWTHGGPTYFAFTYPDSDLVTLETAAKRRPVSALVARRIHPMVRVAIDAARNAHRGYDRHHPDAEY